MPRNFEGVGYYCENADTLDFATPQDLDSLSGHTESKNKRSDTETLRDEIFDRLRELKYDDETLSSFRYLIDTRSSSNDADISLGQDVLLRFFEENDIQAAKDLAKLGVGRDVRTGLRVLADFDLKQYEMAGTLGEYLETIPKEDHARVEQGVLVSLAALIDQSLGDKTAAPRVALTRPKDKSLRIVDGIPVRTKIQPGQVFERQRTEGPSVEEQLWRQYYKSLPDTMSANKIANFLEVTKEWVVDQLTLMGVDSEAGTEIYPKAVLGLLIERANKIPSSDGRITLKELIQRVDMPKRWVLASLSKAGVEPMVCRSLETNTLGEYYAEELVEILMAKKENEMPTEAGDWLSVEEIAIRLDNRSYHWVANQLKRHYHKLGENRKGHDGRLKIHYPPEVLEQLKVETEQKDKLPFKNENELSIGEIARALRLSKDEAAEVLDELGIEPAPRQVPVGTKGSQVVQAYPDIVIGYYKDSERQSLEEIEAQMVIGSLRSQIALRKKLREMAAETDAAMSEGSDKEVASLQERLDEAVKHFNELTDNRYV